MVNQFTPLYYVIAFGGLLMIVGGMWLIYKQKVYLVGDNGQTEVELPFFGKFRTNVPALVLFLIGLVLLIYPLNKVNTQFLRVRGQITSQRRPVVVYAVVETRVYQQDADFDIPIPVVQSENYTPMIVYVAGPSPSLVFDDPVLLKDAKSQTITLSKKIISGSGQTTLYQSTSAPPPAEFLH